VLVMISSMSVPICNCFHARRDNTGKMTTLRRYPSLMPACAGLLEPRGPRLKLLKSAFNAKKIIRRLSWSISSYFVTIYRWNVRCSQKLRKNSRKLLFGGFKVVQNHCCWQI